MGPISGFFAPFQGFAFLARRPRLWRWAAAPVLLNVLLVAVAAWAWTRFMVPWVEGLLPSGEGFFATSGRAIARVIAYVATLPLGLGVYLVAASLVGGPFYEVLCEKVEREVLGERFDAPPARNLVRVFFDGIRVEAANLVVALAGGVIGLLCPIIVPGAGAILSIAISWFLAGFNFIVYPFDRRALGLGRKLGIAFRFLPTTLGFGLAVSLMLVPIVTLPFVAPISVAGAALLFPGAAHRRR